MFLSPLHLKSSHRRLIARAVFEPWKRVPEGNATTTNCDQAVANYFFILIGARC
jgi:hypothetical protein